MEILDLEVMSLGDISAYCLQMYEEIGREQDKLIKQQLILNYNKAAHYYNEQLSKFKKELNVC